MMNAFSKAALSVGVPLILITVAFWARPLSFINGYAYLRVWLSGGQSRSVIVDGIRVHYDVFGPRNGPPLVLVHGLGGHAEDWQNMSPYLVRAGYRIYMIDLPGYGRSDRPASFSYSVRDEAGAVSGFLNMLDVKQVDLGGWSMGGWIVQLAALEHPERIRKLILFDSGGLRILPAWNTDLFAPDSIPEFHELEALLTPHPIEIPDFVSRDIVRRSQENAWVIHRALRTMLTGQDTTDSLLPELKMPVLIVWGTEDRIFPLSQGRTIHHLISQSQFDLVSGCGHLAVILCASQIGPDVVHFLKQ